MNIVYFIPHLRQSSGMERVLCIKANQLAEKYNHQVTIVTYRQFDSPIFFKFSPKVKLIHLNIPDPTFTLHQYNFFERRKRYSNFIATYRKKVEEYLMNNPTDISVSMFLGAEQHFLPRIKDGSKKVLEFHFNFDITSLRFLKEKFSLKNIKNLVYAHQLKKTIKKYDKIIVLTDNDAEDWKKYFDNVTSIPNPITITPIPNLALENKTVIAVGRLSKDKGFDYLIDAWKIVSQKHPNWQLNIYGEGELENVLKQQISDYNLEHSITIHKPTKNIETAYNENSIFVLSSRHEGFVLALIEAMASRPPCVCFDCKYGPKQMINDGHNGFLVELGNIELLAEKVITLIENQELRLKFSKEAKKTSNLYSIDNIMSKWEILFNNLISNSEKNR